MVRPTMARRRFQRKSAKSWLLGQFYLQFGDEEVEAEFSMRFFILWYRAHRNTL
jgi:hypothetical protein